MADIQQMADNLDVMAGALELTAQGRAATMRHYADLLRDDLPIAPVWVPPVGSASAPAEDWYAYSLHDLTGRRNRDNYPHTGLDLNWDEDPWGDVDVGQSVLCVTDGLVVDVGFSERYRGGIVIQVDHFGVPLFVRYWHLQASVASKYQVGAPVFAGEELGTIDYYPGGFAHLHFDMAWQRFLVNWWFSYHPEIEWTNPTYILKTHLDPALVDRMIARGD